MSASIFCDVWDCFNGTSDELLVLLAIADASGADGLFRMTPVDIARKCRMATQHVGLILKRLAASGWIRSEEAKSSREAVLRIAIPAHPTQKKGG